jgi:acyl-CoA synthetase (AMP-forming)/AMP-acid ligase II
MLLRLIERKARAEGAVCLPDISLSWGEVLSHAERAGAEHAHLAGRRVVLDAESPLAMLVMLIAFGDLGAHLVLPPASSGADGVAAVPADYTARGGNDLRIEVRSCAGSESPADSAPPSLTIYSSGTTGEPRPRRWSWDSLLGRVRLPASSRGGAWLTAYPPDTFAGIQAIIYACVGAATLVMLRPADTFQRALRWADHFTLVMATPTFWRRSLMLDAESLLSRVTVETISMGGEPPTQELLDRLGEAFGHPRLVHIYASSERGSIFSVSDGRAGFPASWLRRRMGTGAALAVRDSELYVSPEEGSPFHETGDMVRVEGDRVFFEGRRVEQINVGGRKVSPVCVEAALLSIEGIAEARAYGIASPATGQAVAAELVAEKGHSPDEIKGRVRAYFQQQCAPYERPLKITFVDSVSVTRAGKLARR